MERNLPYYKKNIKLIIERKNNSNINNLLNNKLEDSLNNINIMRNTSSYCIYNIYYYVNYLLLFIHKNRNIIFIFIIFIFFILFIKNNYEKYLKR
jgi:hypothetical protein